MLQPLKNRPLFVREDESLDFFTPKFTEQEINRFLTVHSEEYRIPLGAGGKGTRYWVELPVGNSKSTALNRKQSSMAMQSP